VAILTASLSGFCAVTYALCNSLFVQVVADWTHHPIHWPALNDVLLGLWMIVLAVVHCHNIFVLYTKDIAFMRYIYFLEGVVFVCAALLTAKQGGLAAIIISSLICSTCFTAAYGVWRVSRYFGLALEEVAVRWLLPTARILFLYAPVALGVWFLSKSLQSPVLRLAVHTAISISAGGYIFLRLGLPRGLQDELLRRVPVRLSSLLRWVFSAAT
jgi:hypothetical protein